MNINLQEKALTSRKHTPEDVLTKLATEDKSTPEAPQKKQRKSRKGLAKIFKCTEPGCTKKFTRMEHLSRHQLNHNPKEIYVCGWPGCNKSFVREDLKKRHFKRHEVHGFIQEDKSIQKLRDKDIKDNEKGEIISAESPLQGIEGSASEIISWIFSDAMLANVSDPLLSPGYYSFDSPMALQNLLTPPTAQEGFDISEEKRQKMLLLIPNLLGDLSQLGYNEMDIFKPQYIVNYWRIFHPQWPILHKPTFSADQCQECLLWCVIMIGAALAKDLVLAKTIAEPLRWVIFGAKDFNPPAKLWVIQALLILEVYEKCMGDRRMHVRAVIHHGTTLQLIRRGTILTGEDVFGDGNDPWRKWIMSEATKRAALMAFVLDVYHNCMFGHPSMISIHEIRLSLPCSQFLWDSSSGAQPITPKASTLPVIEALKLTLNNKHVDTSPFGRKAILSGLLSIKLQMLQRDFQLESLDWSSGSLNSWRDHLHASFDFWLNDHRKMLKRSNAVYFDHPDHTFSTIPSMTLTSDPTLPYNTLSLAGCVDPFYHLAHLTLEISVVDLQIIAGAPVMYSRTFRPVDYQNAYNNLKNWAESPNSNDQVRHALNFLQEMFVPSQSQAQGNGCPNPFNPGTIPDGAYSASQDLLTHRPHAVYLATLIIWVYNFVLDGPEAYIWTEYPPIQTPEDVSRSIDNEQQAMSIYAKLTESLSTYNKKSGGEYIVWYLNLIDSPDPRCRMTLLESRNEISGLLTMVIDALKDVVFEWEIVTEDRRLLVHCLERSLGKPDVKCTYHI